MDEEDDLYFDDGIIDELEDSDNQVFDKSLFDDESSRIYGMPLRDPRKLPTAQPQDGDDMPGNNSFSLPNAENSKAGRDLTRVDSRDSFIKYYRGFYHTLSQAASLTKDNLEAYREGFYDQESGFFARANGFVEYANGGYFDPPGTNGIGKSHSGRANFQEQCLTPITEHRE